MRIKELQNISYEKNKKIFFPIRGYSTCENRLYLKTFNFLN